MQLPTHSSIFNLKDVQNILRTENKFISDLLNILPFPTPQSQSDEEEDVTLENVDNEPSSTKHSNQRKKSRAKSLMELQARLKKVSNKKHLSYKERLLKKTIKSKIKKKDKRNQKLIQFKKEHVKQEVTNIDNQNSQLDSTVNVNNGNSNMVFSKFDFAGIGKQKFKKPKQDPQKLLGSLKKMKTKVKSLQESGEIEQAVRINEKVSWKNAFAKAEGMKVKDDEYLLSKSIKRRDQKKKHSKKKWEDREANVKKSQEERQKKRQENIEKRKKEKKAKQFKRGVKKGKIIPGF